jgi:DNA-binding XRE family transcriptional regulator
MEKVEFKRYRKKLQKTQKEMAQLLGVSIKAVHSYEQGWRRVPPSVERQIFFLLSRLQSASKPQENCWDILDCPDELKKNCPAWEFDAGRLCWFINGTICNGTIQKTWKDKMNMCRTCKIFNDLKND